MKKQKGSFTIEAVIWIPFMLCFMLCTIQEGLSFYEESVNRASMQELEEWDGVSRFYEIWVWKEMGENGDKK